MSDKDDRYAVYYEHANENPASCPCPTDCYCRTRTCKDRPLNGLFLGMPSPPPPDSASIAAKRLPVDFDYEAIHPDFLKGLAQIAVYATEKYGSWSQYKDFRLTGEKSPLNHAFEHIRMYRCGEPYERFDGSLRWHLVAAAYNLMMEFFYFARFGPETHPLIAEERRDKERRGKP